LQYNSAMFKCKESKYEQIANSLLRNQPRPKPFARFRGNRLEVGTQSLHRTAKARVWRTFWRIKSVGR